MTTQPPLSSFVGTSAIKSPSIPSSGGFPPLSSFVGNQPDDSSQDQSSLPVENPITKTAQDYSTAIPNLLNEAGRDDNSTSANPVIRTAENSAAATASGIGTIFSPITEAIKSASDYFANSNLGHTIEQNPVIGKMLDFFGGESSQFDNWAQAHPEAARNLSSIFTIGLTAAGGKTDIAEKPIGSAEAIAKAADSVTGKVIDTADAIKNKVLPTPSSADSLAGKIGQGNISDIPKVKAAIGSAVNDASGNQISAPLDTTGVKTYSDLNSAVKDKIAELSKTQDDVIKSGNNSPLKIQQLALKEPVTGSTPVIHNYVIDALNNLKELYSKSNAPADLARINNLDSQLDPIKGEGLTPVQVNNIAREYGTEFRSKAFKANGDPTTSVNGQAYENTRTGLKNTVRSLLPDQTSTAIDKQMSSLYTLRDLTDDMKNKVNAATQRLQTSSVFQKVGGNIGKVLKITGIGDIATKMLGLDKLPGEQTLSPIELESKLSGNISKLQDALNTKDDVSFATKLKNIISAKGALDSVKGNSSTVSKADILDNINHSESMDVQGSIKSGDIQRSDVYSNGETLKPEFAQGRIDDIAEKLDKYKSGLGDKFRKMVDVNNVTMKGNDPEELISIATKLVNGDSVPIKNVPIKTNEGKISSGVLATSVAAPAIVAGSLSSSKKDMTSIKMNSLPSDNAIKSQISFRETGTSTKPYTATNKNKDGTTDLGKYQINTDTLKTYSKQFLGKQVTPDQFLDSPSIQEKFMSAEIAHLKSLGVKKFDTLLALHHVGFSDISSKRVLALKNDPEVKKYIANKPK